jgi:hypothetical protein
VQAFQFRAQFFRMRRQFGGRDAVFARQFVQLGDLRFGFCEAIRIQFQAIAIAADGRMRFAELDCRGIEQLARGREAGIESGQPGQFVLRSRQRT